MSAVTRSPPSPPQRLKVDELYPEWAKEPESTITRVTRIVVGLLALGGIIAIGALFVTHLVQFGLTTFVTGPAVVPFFITVAGTLACGAYFVVLVYRENKKLVYQKERDEEIKDNKVRVEEAKAERAKTKKGKRANSERRVRHKKKKLKSAPAKPLPFTQLYKKPKEKKEWDNYLNSVALTPFIPLDSDVGCSSTNSVGHVPLIGQYGSTYRMAHPHPVVQLPLSHLKQFPKKLQNEVKGRNVKVYFSVQQNPGFTSDTLNLSFHQVIFPHSTLGDENIQMGIYNWDEKGSGAGISESPSREAIAINSLSPQRVYVHTVEESDRLAYSPDNAHFKIDRKVEAVAFASLALIADDRAVVTFSLLLNQGNNRAIQDSLHQPGMTVYTLWKSIQNSGLDPAVISRVGQVLSMDPSLDSDEQDG